MCSGNVLCRAWRGASFMVHQHKHMEVFEEGNDYLGKITIEGYIEKEQFCYAPSSPLHDQSNHVY